MMMIIMTIIMIQVTKLTMEMEEPPLVLAKELEQVQLQSLFPELMELLMVLTLPMSIISLILLAELMPHFSKNKVYVSVHSLAPMENSQVELLETQALL